MRTPGRLNRHKRRALPGAGGPQGVGEEAGRVSGPSQAGTVRILSPSVLIEFRIARLTLGPSIMAVCSARMRNRDV
jgi:hypothetical protein